MDTKICSKCKLPKIMDDFFRDRSITDGRQSYCKQCSKDNTKKYLSNTEFSKKHKQRLKISRPERRRKFRQFIYDYYKSHPCIDCGNSDYRVLQFDHVRGVKFLNIAAMAFYTLDRVKEEIAKCEVRCANCHSIKTSIEQGWYASVSKDDT